MRTKFKAPFPNVRVQLDDNGVVLFKRIFDDQGRPHRTSRPAVIEYHKNGSRKEELYFIHGVLHRDNGPACIQYDKTGRVLETKYYCRGEFVAMDLYLKWMMDSRDPTMEFGRVVQRAEHKKFVARILLQEVGYMIDPKAANNVVALLELIE